MFNFFFPLFFSWMVGENVKEGSLCFVLTFVLFLVLLLIVLLYVFVHNSSSNIFLSVHTLLTNYNDPTLSAAMMPGY